MEVIRKFKLFKEKKEVVAKYIKGKLTPHFQEYEFIPKIQYPYYTIGFVPIRIARFLPNEVSLYVSPGIYPVYSYIPFLRIVSILIPQQCAKFQEKYEVEIVLDNLSNVNIQNTIYTYDLTVAMVFPISYSSFLLPHIELGLCPFVRFDNIYFGEPIYFQFDVCSEKERVYMLKPFMIYPVIQVLTEVWENIENLEEPEEQSESESEEI
jgi:hypothetical protein